MCEEENDAQSEGSIILIFDKLNFHEIDYNHWLIAEKCWHLMKQALNTLIREKLAQERNRPMEWCEIREITDFVWMDENSYAARMFVKSFISSCSQICASSLVLCNIWINIKSKNVSQNFSKE